MSSIFLWLAKNMFSISGLGIQLCVIIDEFKYIYIWPFPLIKLFLSYLTLCNAHKVRLSKL